MNLLRIALTVLLVFSAGEQTNGEVIELDFFGNAGFGLLPGNENPVADPSSAFGGESGTGLHYDDVANRLFMLYEFEGLASGLNASAVGGMHLHSVFDPGNPFTSNGAILFSLNNGIDPNVTNNSSLLPNGVNFGSVDVEVQLSEAQEIELLNGQYYLNIHSVFFSGGELRGNLVRAIPEPASGSVFVLSLIMLAARRTTKPQCRFRPR